MNLAQHPKDGIVGQGAKQQLNSLPTELTQELLSAAILQQGEQAGQARTGQKPQVVIDLCSGYGSLESACTSLGLTYVAVDLVDRRRSRTSHHS